MVDLFLDEINITWKKIFGEDVDKGAKLFLLTAKSVLGGLEKIIVEDLGFEAVIVDPYAKVKSRVNFVNDKKMSVAQGLAIRGLALKDTKGVNFLQCLGANANKSFNVRKELLICGALLVAISFTFLFGIFMRLSYLETKYAQTNSEMKTIFQNVLPGETKIVNPIVQLKHQLQSLQKECSLFGLSSRTGPEPLEILNAITTRTPQEINIRINDIFITSESVRLTGAAQSFESLYKWQQELQKIPHFVTVDIQNNIERQSENTLVRFTILISLETMEKK